MNEYSQNTTPNMEDANKINIQLAEKKIVETSLEAISRSYSPLDKFSMWLLSATGACIALIISSNNILLKLQTNPELYYLVIFFTTCSALSGLIAKFFFTIRIEIYRSCVESVTKNLASVFEEHFNNADRINSFLPNHNTDVNFYRISKQIAKSFPKCFRKKIFKASVLSIRKSLPNYWLCIPLTCWQYFLILAQTVLFLISVSILILGII